MDGREGNQDRAQDAGKGFLTIRQCLLIAGALLYTAAMAYADALAPPPVASPAQYDSIIATYRNKYFNEVATNLTLQAQVDYLNKMSTDKAWLEGQLAALKAKEPIPPTIPPSEGTSPMSPSK